MRPPDFFLTKFSEKSINLHVNNSGNIKMDDLFKELYDKYEILSAALKDNKISEVSATTFYYSEKCL